DGNEASEARFKEIAKAYEVLSDPDLRARYDQFGSTDGINFGDPFGSGTGGLGDLFDAFFGGGGFGGRARGPAGPPRGPDLEVTATLEFSDAVFGCQTDVTVRTAVSCEICDGSGATEGTSAVPCADCSGTGEQRVVRQSMLGQIVSATVCRTCGGQGMVIADPCDTCRGEGRTVIDKTFTVDVPAGVDTGSTLRLSGRGAVGPRRGQPGDLYVKIKVRPHEIFVRQGYDLVHELRITMTQAALGHHLLYDTLDGAEDLVIPKGTQSGRVFRLRHRGVPHLEGRGRGDLLVKVVVSTPTELRGEEEELLERLAALRGEEIQRPDTGLLSRIRSAFR
ncbi:MAG TPA: DnaJ C-terminal domain-containing protein, partial [Microthrixaceae bacterium]|nr:DnaJ C-terminal domain-containing protein [Microthrixaceae bacterium]